MENPNIKRFGRYEIVAELGRGAMGVVYQARDPQIDRTVAVKTVALLGQEREQEDEYRQRFRHEAQAAGRLHHPGIVAIFDLGEDPENHNPYLVLEYVAGESLNRILSREKKLPLLRTLQLVQEIAEALDYAHSQGVVHRDIKPANILITEDGHAKIADFGIAQLNLAHFTLPGRVLGTPAYMAPEQLMGEGADGRSDLFSLGVLLYAMVTGHSPFQGTSATTVCFKVVNREPMLASALDLDLPRSLDGVISRAMAKDPAERYQTGAQFAWDLHHLYEQCQRVSTGSAPKMISAMRTEAQTGPGQTKADPPAEQLADAAQRVGRVLRGASLKDVVLATTAVIALLLLVGFLAKPAPPAPKTQAVTRTAPVTSAATAPTPATILSAIADAEGAQAADSSTSPAEPQPRREKPATRSLATSKPAATRNPESHPATTSEHSVIPQVVKQVVVPTATVQITVQHQFKDATLSVWIDDKLVLTHSLHGGAEKRLVVFHGVHGVDSETLQVPAGTHILRFRAQTADQSTELSKTVSADFAGGDDKTLQITFDKHNSTMHLSWQ
jgi:serine/threonine-protein kinase